MSDWVLLIPPSEGKAAPPASGPTLEKARSRSKSNAFPTLDPLRDMVLEGLSAVIQRSNRLDLFFELTNDTLADAIRLNSGILTSPTAPARDVYSGVMYDAVAFKTLKAPEKKLFDQKTLIISGLYGLLRPTDLIAPYKLKISSDLGGVVGKLTQFWRRPVSELLRREVRGKVVWDFLPEAHRRVWDSTGETAARHQVRFVKRVVRSGVAEYKTISHHSKSLKGALIRHLLARNAADPEQLHDFQHPDGYRFNRELSVFGRIESTLVFSAE
ncbi:peroxide stress protein YaaA [bacterium]|nr:peroxide stress protein YaaA [bacterium]